MPTSLLLAQPASRGATPVPVARFEGVATPHAGLEAFVAWPYRVPNQGPESVFRLVWLKLPQGGQALLVCEPHVNPGFSPAAMLPELRRTLAQDGVAPDAQWVDLTESYSAQNRPLMSHLRRRYLAFPVSFTGNRAAWGPVTDFQALGEQLGVPAALLEVLCLSRD